ncbi:hypothetical protein JCM19237_1870 [Photobacterium aphoticum]|uniref:Uncharacterized protein n=1 Tax=Photobacterium aphoticum TaxID=754436 RepID=A0A090QSQ6_9GAMM|nr:hypothetical protein JCM19237_1870 [Photobacterium aphoticum]
MTHTFYNPFHFIPFNDKAHTQNNGLDYNTIKTGQTHVTHQGWQTNTLSGAIYVALTNKSGLIVGDGVPHDDKDAPANTVRFYRTTTPANPGTPQLSIPANSLRGMVASTAEIISDSAMRVINDTHYSSRVTASPDNTFSTLGLIVRENDELKLKPLNLGRLTLTDKSGLPEFNQEYNDGVLDECCYQNTEFWEDFLIYHVHCYNNICGKSVEVTGNFLSRLNVPLECYHHNDNNPKFIFIKKKYEFTSIADSLCESGYPGKLKIDQIKNNEYMLSGLHLPADEADDAFFGTSQDFLQHINVNPSLNKNDFIKCILYCKGDIEKRDAQLPATKLYEYLIPFSDEKLTSTTAFTIPKEVLERFNAILNNNRHNNLIPNNWKKHKKGDIHHVEEGDIYYFKLDCEKEIITELSLSQIWRKEVTGQSTYGIMKNAGHDHYLPWGQRSDTQSLTPAECVFGAVETLPETAGNNHQAGRALASRVRFYDAVKLNADLATRLSRPLTLSSPTTQPIPLLVFTQRARIRKKPYY